MNYQNEYERRYRAIQLYNEGIGFNKILRLVQRCKDRLSKWLKRYRKHGAEGLKDRSRAPKRIWSKTRERGSVRSHPFEGALSNEKFHLRIESPLARIKANACGYWHHVFETIEVFSKSKSTITHSYSKKAG